MAWRAMNSLLVLRSQVNALAPNRKKGSDGLVGDANHQINNPGSGHNPHNVPGVGPEMVTALDLTHDPAGGCDTYQLSEVLRRKRDPRIYYVISNRRIFSSYSTSSRAAWEWGEYSGSDPHTGHSHNQVKDAPISDTGTPWDLEGFMATQFNADDIEVLRGAALAVLQYSGRGIGENDITPEGNKSVLAYLDEILDNSRASKNGVPTILAAIAASESRIMAKLEEIEEKIGQGGPAAGSFTMSGTISGSGTVA